MIGYYCTTSYHLMIAILIALCKGNKAKQALFITPHFKNIHGDILFLKKSGLFKDIIYLDDHYGSRCYLLYRKYRNIFFYKNAKLYCLNNKFREFIFFPGSLFFACYFAKMIFSNSPECEFSFGEDGLASYINHAEYRLQKRQSKFFLKLFGVKKYLKFYSSLYVIEPDLVINEGMFLLKKIQRKQKNTYEFKELIERVFGHNELPPCDVLFLQQPFMADSAKLKKLDEIQTKALAIVSKLIGSKKGYVKIHPRTISAGNIPKNLNVIAGNGLFEASIVKKINHEIIVTVCSTAAISPFIIWGYTPTIYLLYKIDKNFSLSRNLKIFLEKFKVKYQESGGKIYEPESLDDFYSALKNNII